MLTVRSAAVGLAGAVLALGGLSACGSDEKPPKPAATRASASASASSYLPVPATVSLTEPGTELALGQEGTVAFQRRQGQVGVLAVTVTRIEPTTFKASFRGWRIAPATVASRTPYFVRVKVRNVGELGLAGLRLDGVLYADDGTTLEAPNYYRATQLKSCTGGALPVPFATGATVELCQVYYVTSSRRVESISFQPFGGGEPITWSGPYSKVGKPGAPAPTSSASGSPSASASASPSASSAVSPSSAGSATP